MLRTKVVKGVLGVSALAAAFVALAVHAQSAGAAQQGSTGTSATGPSTAGQGTAQGSTQGSGPPMAGQADGQPTPMPSPVIGSRAELSRADRRMLIDLAQANMAEIEASRMAQTKSQSEQVKNFAQQMIDDHTRALGEVQQLAQAKGVTLPAELNRLHRTKAKRLGALSGEAFDRAYMAQAGVADHKKTHSLLRQAQTRAKDPDLKALAARTLPVVDQHLNSANQLHQNTARGASKTEGQTGSSDRR